MNTNDDEQSFTHNDLVMVHSEKLEYHNLLVRNSKQNQVDSAVSTIVAASPRDLSWDDCCMTTNASQLASWSSQAVPAGDDRNSLESCCDNENDSNDNSGSAGQLILSSSSPAKAVETDVLLEEFVHTERLVFSPADNDDTAIVESVQEDSTLRILDSNDDDDLASPCAVESNSLLETLKTASPHDLVEALTRFHEDMNDDSVYNSLLSGDSMDRKSPHRPKAEAMSASFLSKRESTLGEQVMDALETCSEDLLDVPEMAVEENSKMRQHGTFENRHSPLPHDNPMSNQQQPSRREGMLSKVDVGRDGSHSSGMTTMPLIPANLYMHDNTIMETAQGSDKDVSQGRHTPQVALPKTQTGMARSFVGSTPFGQHLTCRRIVLIFMVAIPVLTATWDCLCHTYQFFAHEVEINKEIFPTSVFATTKQQTETPVVYNAKTVLDDDETLLSSNESSVSSMDEAMRSSLQPSNSHVEEATQDLLKCIISQVFTKLPSDPTTVIDNQEPSFAKFGSSSREGLFNGIAPILLFLVFVFHFSQRRSNNEVEEPTTSGSFSANPKVISGTRRGARPADTQQFLTILQIYFEKVSEDVGTFQQIDKMSLRKFLEERSLPVGMTKADMIGRLVVHYRKELKGMRYNDLRKMLKQKGLCTTGKKEELILRLLEDGFLTDMKPIKSKQRVCYSSKSTQLNLTNYAHLRTVDLQKLLKERQCSCSFSKQDLILRVVHFYKQELDACSYRKLHKMLKAKDLIQSGHREELVTRLVEAGL